MPLLAAKVIRRWYQKLRSGEDEVPTAVARRIMEMRSEVGGTQFETFATKTEGFVEAIERGGCELLPECTGFSGNAAHFVDGRRVEVDVVVFCTGFEQPAVPIQGTKLDVLSANRYCLPTEHDGTLAYIGFVRPNIGAMPALAEMQARWWAQLVSGRVTIGDALSPSRALWSEDGLDDRVDDLHRRVPTLVDFATYMDELASLVGCKPDLWTLARHPLTLLRLYGAPFCGVQYRLVGPHAAPSLARNVYSQVPTHADINRIFEFFVCATLSRLGVRSVQPRLSLGR